MTNLGSSKLSRHFFKIIWRPACADFANCGSCKVIPTYCIPAIPPDCRLIPSPCLPAIPHRLLLVALGYNPDTDTGHNKHNTIRVL